MPKGHAGEAVSAFLTRQQRRRERELERREFREAEEQRSTESSELLEQRIIADIAADLELQRMLGRPN